ncbi:MAG TPA: DNA repair protein RecN, partial [Candidatus Dormibacteraeota bacterium]|nr:DNA repair protein RecN [Candidatus Dormibacteraeota bacterium]
LAAERETLANAERLREAAATISAALGGGDDSEGALEALYRAEAAAQGPAVHDPRLAAMAEQLRSLALDLGELRRSAAAYLDAVQADPARLQAVEDRLEQLGRLKHRHGGSLEAVLEVAEAARRRLGEDERRAEALAEARAALVVAATALSAAALALRRTRQEAAARLGAGVEAEIAELNMERARFQVALTLEDDPDGVEVEGRLVACGPTGADRVEVLLAANPGEPALPLQKVASGGEVSRVMLALRGVMAGADRIPTIVLDEIDVGIGGRTAVRLGERLRAIAGDRQVICVTHLAAVAAVADRHLQVRKELAGGRHVVAVEALDGEARLAELARLLAGDRGGDAALETARSLLAGTGG